MEIEMITSKKDDEDFEQKEWPGVQADENRITRIKPRLLITELGRLVPFEKGQYVRFFPINMPTIEIDCIQIIGLILEVSRKEKQYEFTVDDGTGILDIIYSLKRICSTQELNQGKAQTSKDDPKDIVSIPKKEYLNPGDYVHLQGYFSLSEYNKTYKSCEEKNPLKRFTYGKPIFFTVNIETINEKQYYDNMSMWFKEAEKRYIE